MGGVLWCVDFAKRGGWTVQPRSGQAPELFPIFRTQVEVRNWLSANGYKVHDQDDDAWLGPIMVGVN